MVFLYILYFNMKIIRYAWKVLSLLAFLLYCGGCSKSVEEDPCPATEWPQIKELEIKLAVKVLTSNPVLPGATPGYEYPADFREMVVSGTIEKEECSAQRSGLNNLGSTYITQGIDIPAPVNESEAYWIGPVVYVYDLSNDKDHFNINLTIRITMDDNRSYMCKITDEIFYPQIMQVPMELYHYILTEIYSTSWVKV